MSIFSLFWFCQKRLDFFMEIDKIKIIKINIYNFFYFLNFTFLHHASRFPSRLDQLLVCLHAYLFVF